MAGAMSSPWRASLYCARVRCSMSGRTRKESRAAAVSISFDEGAMTFPEEELPDVADAAHAVVRDAMDAGVWVFGGGLFPR